MPYQSLQNGVGLSHEALNTIYKGAILPLLLHGAPVWIEALENKCYRTVYNRLQSLINKNSKSISNNIQRSSLRLDWFNSNCVLCWASGQIIHHEEKSIPCDWLWSTAKRLASPSRLSQNHWTKRWARYTSIYKQQQERPRGRSWNSNIYPQQTRASIKVYTSQQILQQSNRTTGYI